jgi:hypothetical protein
MPLYRHRLGRGRFHETDNSHLINALPVHVEFGRFDFFGYPTYRDLGSSEV